MLFLLRIVLNAHMMWKNVYVYKILSQGVVLNQFCPLAVGSGKCYKQLGATMGILPIFISGYLCPRAVVKAI